MFALRCLDVSLAFFLAVYGLLSFAVTRTWRPFARLVDRQSPRVSSNLLFGLRVSPFVLALGVTAIFVLPSFLLLEPRSGVEPIGEMPLALSLCCIALAAAGVYSAIRAQARVTRAVELWLHRATPAGVMSSIPVYRIRPSVPALTVVGVRGPKVLVSDAAAALLTAQELDRALEHEIAHVRRRDNLKKLIFRFTTFPGMGALEAKWSELGEMAADDAAVKNASDALDLASALIKLSRLAPCSLQALPASGILSGSVTALNARVERLISWQAASAPENTAAWYVVPTALALGAAVVISYSALLLDLHKITEWLVR